MTMATIYLKIMVAIVVNRMECYCFSKLYRVSIL